MSLKPEEISKLIKDQIRRYDEDLEIDETGTIITVGDGIALIYGLQNAMAGELLRFPVPDASVPAVEICSEISAAVTSFSA